MIELRIQRQLAEFSLHVDETIDTSPLAVFGHSGAGKSTLLRCIAGLDRPNSGRIAIDGDVLLDSKRDIHIPVQERQIGYVPQDGLLFPHLSVKKNLLYGFKRIYGRKRTIEFDDVLKVLEIGELLDRDISTLSGGERQRVSLGRALLASPRLLLFDEPLASVDRRLKGRILPYLIRAIEHFAIPTVYVSHDHEEVAQIAREILVLDRGRAVACGPYLEIVDNPAVFGLFSREGIDNIIRVRVARHDATQGFTLVEAGKAQFAIPPISLPVGEELSIGIKAGDIILALDRPSRISTRNALEGEVQRIVPVGDILLAHIDVGCELLVELTPSAVNELGLTPGVPLWALIKTNAFKLHSLTEAATSKAD